MQILYSYFRYTGILFLRCALFVARCNTIRTSWENQKERLCYRKKYIEEFVWGIPHFWLHRLPSMSSCCFLCLLPPTFQLTCLRNSPYEDIHIAMGGILGWYHEKTVENRKIFYNLILNTFLKKQRFFSSHPQCCLAFSWTNLQM